MKQILQRICELQPEYSYKNTTAMQERSRLINHDLANEIKLLEPVLSQSLGPYGSDFSVGSSDGQGNKVPTPWVRFHSDSMSPSPRDGYYSVIHFKCDGSGIYFTLGCGSTSISDHSILKPSEIAKKIRIARNALATKYGELKGFSDQIELGAKGKLSKSFEQATAIAKFVSVDELDEVDLTDILSDLAIYLRTIYEDVQSTGVDLSEADQAQIDIEKAIRPARRRRSSQGYGLNAKEKRAVELRAMEVADQWLKENGYSTKDTSANQSYDIQATLGKTKIFVEVKGTTSPEPNAILMTANEVELHRKEKGHTALAVVSSIKLTKGEIPTATGGTLDMQIGWDIDDWNIQPTAYRLEK